MAKSRKSGSDEIGGEKPKRGARGLWNGAISFSLIHIPVSLHTAARAHELDLNLLDKRDFAPVGYQRYNKATGKVVEWNDVVKGYEYEKGEYVVLTDEDFRRANVEASRTIDIQTFVDRDAISPYYFDTPYFLVPDKNGERVYALLRGNVRAAQPAARRGVDAGRQDHRAEHFALPGGDPAPPGCSRRGRKEGECGERSRARDGPQARG